MVKNAAQGSCRSTAFGARTRLSLDSNTPRADSGVTFFSQKEMSKGTRKRSGSAVAGSAQANINNVKQDHKTHRKKSSQDNPGRPPNAFILYRSAKLKEVSAAQLQDRHVPGEAPKSNLTYQQNLSRQIAERWRNETVEVKESYYAKSAVLACEHKIKYPNYKYQPKRRSGTGTEPAPPLNGLEVPESTPTSVSSIGVGDSRDSSGRKAESLVVKGKRRVSSEVARAKASPYPPSNERRISLEIATISKRKGTPSQPSSPIFSNYTTTCSLARSISHGHSSRATTRHHQRTSLDADGEFDAQRCLSTLLATEPQDVWPVPVGVAVSTVESAIDYKIHETDFHPARKALRPSTRKLLEDSLARRGMLHPASSLGPPESQCYQSRQPADGAPEILSAPPTSSWSQSVPVQGGAVLDDGSTVQASSGSARMNDIFQTQPVAVTPTALEPESFLAVNHGSSYEDLSSWQFPPPAWMSHQDWSWPLSVGDTEPVLSVHGHHENGCANTHSSQPPCCHLDSALPQTNESLKLCSASLESQDINQDPVFNLAQFEPLQPTAYEMEYAQTEELIRQALTQNKQFRSVATSPLLNSCSSHWISSQADHDQRSADPENQPHHATCDCLCCPEGFKSYLDPRLSHALFFSPPHSETESSYTIADFCSPSISPTTNFSRPFDFKFEPCRASSKIPTADTGPPAECNPYARVSSPTKRSTLKDWSNVQLSNFKGKMSKLKSKPSEP